MMQPTHLKFGVAWGLLAIPIAVALGLIPTLSSGFSLNELIIITIGLYAAVKGAIFGSEMPDTDHPTSIPARKHPIWAFVYKMGRKLTGEESGQTNRFKKKWFAHRGIMSHDYVVHLLFWGLVLVLVKLLGSASTDLMMNHGWFMWAVYALIVLIIWSFAGDILNFAQFILAQAGVEVPENKLVRIGVFAGAVGIVFVVMNRVLGGSFMDILTLNLDAATSSLVMMWFFYGAEIFIIFTLIGCWSHLFGDMITVSGVYLGTHQIRPMSMFKILTKIPGLNLAFDGFRTGGPWERLNNTIITIVIFPATALALMTVFGWEWSVITDLVGVFTGDVEAE